MIEITRLKKRNGSLSKKIHRGADGKPANDSSNCRMSEGTAYRQPLSGLPEFATLIEGMPRNECIALGAMRQGLPEQVSIVKKDDKRASQPGFASRTQDVIIYNETQPALVLLDFDRKGMPRAAGEHIDKEGGFLAALGEVCPEFVNTGYVRRASTSSNIIDITTGEPIPAGGQHVFVLIADGADVKRFLYTLHDRCWLAGLGWFIVGSSGQLLDRSIVDRCVFGGERLVFEGPPELDSSFRQQGKREAFVHEGTALDSVTTCPELTASEKDDLADLQSEAKKALGRECEVKRKEFIKEHAEAAIAKGMPRAKAEAMAAGWGKGVLRPGVTLVFDALGEVDVAAVLADPGKFEGEACADPIEGPAYGPVTAKFYLHPTGFPFIRSFAHGGINYRLVHDYDTIEAAIHNANIKEAVTTFVRLAIDAGLAADEEKLLAKAAGTRSGVGVKVAEQMMKMARAEALREKHKHAAASSTKAGVVLVNGIEKRLTGWASLNERYAILQAKALPSVYIFRKDFLPIQDTDLKRRLAGEVVYGGIGKNGEPLYVPAFKFWTENAYRHVYQDIVFTSQPTSDTSYNLYRELGVKPAPGKCRKIRAHVWEVICSKDRKTYKAMIRLLAWQIQNIGEPSRVIVAMHNPKQQAGKGIFLEEVLLKLYGPSGFSPSTIDQVLGRFNDTIRGRSFIFCDEVLFAGDLKAANALKALSTTTHKGLETKNLPVVTCPVGVNLWLASNSDAPVHIEEGDARYWTLRINEGRIGDTNYFIGLMDEIRHGGLAAFAHFLLNLDVSKFIPKRDVPRDNTDRRDIIKQSLNPYDARCWLRDSTIAEEVLGMGVLGNIAWEKGAEHEFRHLSGAYTKWQTTVKTRVAPRPTKLGNLGEVLGKAGLTASRDDVCRKRVLPSTAECLTALDDPEKWRD